MDFTIKNIQLDQIIDDDFYRVTDVLESKDLIESIKSVSLLSPLIVQPIDENSYRLVTGFRRMDCLKILDIKSVPVKIEKRMNLDLFKTAIYDNLPIRSFNPVEVSTIIDKLESQFDVEKKEIIKFWLPMLGFGRNPKIFDLYKPLAFLSDGWKQALKDEAVALETIILVKDATEQDKNVFLELIQHLKLGKNRQREFWGLLADVSRKQNCTLPEFLATDRMTQILSNEKFTHSQKTERLKAFLWEKRYPRYSKVKNEFDSLLSQAMLPPDMNLQPPQFFEGEKYNLNISFTSQDDLKNKIELIARAIDNQIIDKMTKLS